ncbi:LacI family DNA-binding transcriptional regulator [soil metagenome]
MSKPLWSQIYEELERDILSGKFAPDAALPPELEIAARWGVSRLTAHRALYELQRAGFVTRKRKVGTVVLAQRTPQARRIGALFFHAGDFFQGNLLGAVRSGLSEECHLSYVDTNRDAALEAAALQKMREESDGIVLFPTCDPANDALLTRLVEENVPLVCIDRHPARVPCDSVQTDNYAATRWLLQGLVTDGHQRIACVCDFEEPVSSTGDRVRAYRDLMEMTGGDSRRWFHAFPYLAPDSEEEYRQMVEMARDAIAEMRDGGEPPTAVFCTREHYATAFLEAWGAEGTPEVAAFVDRPSYLMALPDTVRRVTQDLDAIGRLAAERSARRVRGEPLEPEQFLVPAREMAE